MKKEGFSIEAWKGLQMKKLILILIFPLFLGACSSVLPVPGGGETINKDFYKSDSEFKALLNDIKMGDSKEHVFSHLGRVEEDFIMLTRDEIMSTLYGGQRLEFVQNLSNPLDERSFLQELKGYKLIYKKVNRKHGIHNPISMRTNEFGYSYETTFIFKNGILYEDPVLSGGAIDASSTNTIFDYLTSSNALKQVGL